MLKKFLLEVLMNKKSKLALFSFIPLVIICVTFRVIQYAFAVDFNTGFLKADAGVHRYSLTFCLILSFIIYLSLALLDKSKNSKAFTIKKEEISPKLLKVFGFSLILSAVTIVIKIPEVIKAGRKEYLLLFFMFFGILMLVCAGFYILVKGRVDGVSALLFAGIAVYVVLRSSMFFLDRMVVLSVPQYILEILSRLSLVFFLLSLARMMLDSEKKFTRLTVIVMGLFSATMIFTTELGAFFTTFVADENVFELVAYPHGENLFMGIFTLVGIIMLYCGKVNKPVETGDLTESIPDVDNKNITQTSDVESLENSENS